ncbi:hypothetical protein GN958_ATG04364 [Phytophthora infestans]|uniref:Uncharacterized protein n=1 Tax=Phytophthora infestans TaxID=4787 RepID=A0A8S9UZF7_PHYIN|nr:hypothetical protein GN958_ATG04364 [Phytophthora infestans]
MADRQAAKAAAKKNTAAKKKGGPSCKTKTSTPKGPHVVITTAEEDDLRTPDESSVGLPGQSQQPVGTQATTAQVQAPDSPDRSTVTSTEHGPDEASRTDATFDDEALNSDLDGEDGADPDECIS